MVLIVDDTPKNIQVIGSILMQKNYRISVAKNGREALKVVKDAKPDIILLDIMMPELDGFETCRQLKNSQETRDIPIIFLTAKIEAEDIVKAFELGAVDYVIKPFNSKELLVRINTHLELKYAHEKIKKSEQELRKVNAEIEAQNNEITCSIQYASRIQNALLPPDDEIKRLLPSYFILTKPKDIVSGDFYWLAHKDDKVVIVVADSTGHGVPGAFMSILGVSFLNEIVNKAVTIRANELLNQLSGQVIKSLHQTGRNDKSRDGMEMAMCVIDFSRKKLQFSGAFRPLYLIHNNELKEFKGDSMPIGIYEQDDQSFTNTELFFEKNDIFYLFTDGYVDQLGGDDRKRLRSGNLKEFLIEIHNLSMADQKKALEKKYEDWRGEIDQVDDILFVGIKM
jgi:DNA-binding response OmpR family regulator